MLKFGAQVFIFGKFYLKAIAKISVSKELLTKKNIKFNVRIFVCYNAKRVKLLK